MQMLQKPTLHAKRLHFGLSGESASSITNYATSKQQVHLPSDHPVRQALMCMAILHTEARMKLQNSDVWLPV